MSNYSKTTDFAAKDSLPSGDSGKIIRGSEFETEFDNISTAIATKADAASPTFTGTVTIDGLTVNGNTVLGNAATDTVTVTADIASNLLPSADDTYNLGASGAEWNDLFIDGTANIDSLVAGSGSFTSISTTGDVTFGDNDKALFGAGSDLQIYHDGSNSRIQDAGTGSLLIRANGAVQLENTNGDNMLFANAGGSVDLYHNASKKLETTSTGIDVTGVITTDGMTVESASNTTIRISDSTSVNQRLDFEHNAGVSKIIAGNNGAYGSLKIQSFNGTATIDRLQIKTSGDIEFYEDTGTTAKLTWDASAESLNFADNGKAIFGAGSDLQIYHNGNNSFITDTGTGGLYIRASDSLRVQSATNEEMIKADANGPVTLYHNNASRLATTSTGINVTGSVTSDELDLGVKAVIGGSTPRIELLESDTTDLNTRIRNTNGTLQIQSTDDAGTTSQARIVVDHATGDISFREDTGTTAKFFWDASAESLGIGQAPTSALHVINSAASGESIATLEAAPVKNGYVYINGDDNRRKSLVFQSGGVDKFSMGVGDSDELSTSSFFIGSGKHGGSAADLVIDSDGRTLFGKTTAGTTNIGTQISGDGFAAIVATSANVPLYLQNKAVNGNCRISFTNNSHGSASFGLNNGGDFTIFDSTAAITRFNVTDAKILTATGGLAGIELGGSGAANRLDDYEEGTWTPVIADANTGGNTGTAGTLDGAYTKVGRQVTVTFRAIDINTTGMTSSNNLVIQGLPFTTGTGLKGIGEGSVRLDLVNLNDNACNVTCSVGSSGSVITFRQTVDNGNDEQIAVSSYNSGSADLLGTITYFTN